MVQDIQEFQISLTPIGAHQYLVRTEKVSPGVPLAEEQVTWPIDVWMRQAQRCMVSPLLGLLSSDASELQESGVAHSSSSGLLHLGHQLYQALFTGSLRDSWVIAQGIANHRNTYLRLRLGLKGTDLLALPWEVMHDGDRARPGVIYPVATGEIMFSRYQAGVASASALRKSWTERDPILRILVVISLPDDQARLALAQEVQHLKQELEKDPVVPDVGSDRPPVQLTILEQPDREQLTQALEQGQYDVLHYSGHSDLGEMGGDLHLVNRRTGLTESLSGQDLAGLLVNNGIRLVVLNSCRGAYSAAANAQGEMGANNLAAAIVRRGVPAVLAMAECIPDDVALTLTQLFYRNLRQGYPIDLSLNRARQALMSVYTSDYLYWALPVLYLHPDSDGYLVWNDRLQIEQPGDWLGDDGGLLPDWSSDGLEPLNPMDLDSSPIATNQTQASRVVDGTEAPDSKAVREQEADLLDELPNEDDALVVSDLIRQLSDSPPSLTALQHGEEQQPDLDVSEHLALEPQPTAERTSGIKEMPLAPRETVTPTQTSVPNIAPWVGLQGANWRWRIIAGGVVVMLVLGVLQWQRSPQDVPAVVPGDESNALNGEDLPADDGLNQETREAIEALQQADIDRANQLITQLLDEGNITAAASALDSAPVDYVADPTVSFLRGRLAWQSARLEDPDFNPSDAILLWRTAVQGRPDSVLYGNALGFAYAEDGQWEQALQVWQETLDRQAADPVVVVESDGWIELVETPSLQGLAGDRDQLTTYAGLAIALYELAEQGQLAEPDRAVEVAIALRQQILEQSPAEFQLTSLEADWLWTPAMMERWQQLRP
ncbi:MAG: CHAT domain-containing protein [Leptolyngbya sp. DLM2.Bin15]|nr:MAG: CHAT domain-containing protein [Leptolyngbya sp. DLM2.Bin15]